MWLRFSFLDCLFYRLCYIWGCMCSSHPFSSKWSRVYLKLIFVQYHHQIRSINISHDCHIFPWLCTWGGCATIFYQLLYINPGKVGVFVSITAVQSMICVNNWVHYSLKVVFVCSHLSLHYASSLCWPVSKHWTYKMLGMYILSSHTPSVIAEEFAVKCVSD